MGKTSIKLIANNKKAYHDFFIEDTFEAGISLHGTEVKSLRMGKCSIKEAFVRIENGEVFVYGMHISPYEKGNIFNKDPLRVKKLLMHRYEINKLMGKIKEKGGYIAMTRFSDEEKSIISMYNTADRVGLIVKIKEAIPYIEDADLKNTAADIVSKLVGMTDKEFADLEV